MAIYLTYNDAQSLVEQQKTINQINRAIIDRLKFNSVARLHLFQNKSGELILEVVAKNGRDGQLRLACESEFLESLAQYIKLFHVPLTVNYTVLSLFASRLNPAAATVSR